MTIRPLIIKALTDNSVGEGPPCLEAEEMWSPRKERLWAKGPGNDFTIGEEDGRPPPETTETVGHTWTMCPNPEE